MKPLHRNIEKKIQPVHYAFSLAFKYFVRTHLDNLVKKTDQIHTPRKLKNNRLKINTHIKKCIKETNTKDYTSKMKIKKINKSRLTLCT